MGRDALKVVLNSLGVLATRCVIGNLIEVEWNCLTVGRRHSLAGTSAVLRIWIAGALARDRPSMLGREQAPGFRGAGAACPRGGDCGRA